MKYEFCQPYCLMEGLEVQCAECHHKDDVLFEPVIATTKFKNPEDVLLVGRNGDMYYLDGGNSMIHKDMVEIHEGV